jgi:hypothetical protein
MGTRPLHLSLSQPTLVRWEDIRADINGQPADPRGVYAVQFQLLAPGATVFGPWAPGTWDPYAPTPTGPFSATVVIGPSHPAPVNPAQAGTYALWGQMVSGTESPSFLIQTVVLAAP